MSVTFAVRGLAYRSARSFYRALKRIFKPAVQRQPGLHRFARASKEAVKDLIRPRAVIYSGLPESLTSAPSVPAAVFQSERDPRLPKWLIDEWKEIHEIEPQLFPVQNIQFNIVTDYIHQSKVGEHYLDLCALYGEGVSHVFLVPWLKKGGADLVALNYVRALTGLGLEKRVVVITTEDADSPWAKKLPAEAGLIEFGKRYSHLTSEEQEKLLTRVLLQMAPQVVHNINSHLGYRVFIKYGKALSSIAHLYASAFCEDITAEDRVVGYPVCFLPDCFDSLTAVFFDNQNTLNKLREIFAFEKEKLFVHYQPVDLPPEKRPHEKNHGKEHLDILWASRLDIQKRPDILIKIAERCQKLPFRFHVYGTSVYGTTKQEAELFVRSLNALPNVRYYGPFDGLPSLPVENYDLYLYTSQWDGLPNVLLEAVAMGLPVVASNTGGIGDLITHGKTGFIIEPYDDIEKYVNCLTHIYQNQHLLQEVYQEAHQLVSSRHSGQNFVESVKRSSGYASVGCRVTAKEDKKMTERASAEEWERSQEFELDFWKNHWPHRHLAREELIGRIRAGDARWFLTSFGFEETEGAYKGFAGDVLEIGCGPIGFFESIKNIRVKGTDSLMRKYAETIPFSRYGKINNYEYTDQSIENISDKYDFVVCSNVLDHTADWKKFLQCLILPLKPDRGELLLFTNCRYESVPGHTQVYGPAELFNYLLELDLNILFFKVLPNESLHAKYDCYVRLRKTPDQPSGKLSGFFKGVFKGK